MDKVKVYYQSFYHKWRDVISVPKTVLLTILSNREQKHIVYNVNNANFLDVVLSASQVDGMGDYYHKYSRLYMSYEKNEDDMYEIIVSGEFISDRGLVTIENIGHIYSSELLIYKDLYEADLKMSQLQNENDQLRTQLEYQPGGSGYYRAKSHFDSLKQMEN